MLSGVLCVTSGTLKFAKGLNACILYIHKKWSSRTLHHAVSVFRILPAISNGSFISTFIMLSLFLVSKIMFTVPKWKHSMNRALFLLFDCVSLPFFTNYSGLTFPSLEDCIFKRVYLTCVVCCYIKWLLGVPFSIVEIAQVKKYTQKYEKMSQKYVLCVRIRACRCWYTHVCYTKNIVHRSWNLLRMFALQYNFSAKIIELTWKTKQIFWTTIKNQKSFCFVAKHYLPVCSFSFNLFRKRMNYQLLQGP